MQAQAFLRAILGRMASFTLDQTGLLVPAFISNLLAHGQQWRDRPSHPIRTGALYRLQSDRSRGAAVRRAGFAMRSGRKGGEMAAMIETIAVGAIATVGIGIFAFLCLAFWPEIRGRK